MRLHRRCNAMSPECASCPIATAWFSRSLEDLPSPLPTPPQHSPSLREAIALMIDEKREAGRREGYVRGLAGILKTITRHEPERAISTVTAADLLRWCTTESGNKITRQTYMRCAGVLFKFAVRRGWAQTNPLANVEPVTVDEQAPKILTPQQAADLMAWVRCRRPDALAFFSLSLFAGLRPDETSRIGWSSIDEVAATITVDSAASKTRRRRIVHIEPAACAWLADARSHNALLPYPPRRRMHRQRQAAQALGLSRWPQDVLRHSAASYWYALTRDAARVAADLGHSVTVLMRHYRELVTSEASKRFWSIFPQTPTTSDNRKVTQ